jgi:hypothetical protein
MMRNVAVLSRKAANVDSQFVYFIFSQKKSNKKKLIRTVNGKRYAANASLQINFCYGAVVVVLCSG